MRRVGLRAMVVLNSLMYRNFNPGSRAGDGVDSFGGHASPPRLHEAVAGPKRSGNPGEVMAQGMVAILIDIAGAI